MVGSNFEGQHVLITGGSEGIGLELAKQFRSNGAHVSIVSRSKSKLDAAFQILEKDSQTLGKVFSASADVTDMKQISEAVIASESNIGPLDILICCAGFSRPGLFLEVDLPDHERVMTVNYFGTLKTIKAVAPRMIERGHGKIVIVGSALSIIGYAGYSAYAPSKWALRGLADCLRNEFQGTGVTVSIAYPPDTLTPGFEKENETKHPATLAVERETGSEVFPAEQVAKCIVQGVKSNHYHLSSPDLGANMLLRNMAGVTPRTLLGTLLDCFLQPILCVVAMVMASRMDAAASKYAAGTKDPSPDK